MISHVLSIRQIQIEVTEILRRQFIGHFHIIPITIPQIDFRLRNSHQNRIFKLDGARFPIYFLWQYSTLRPIVMIGNTRHYANRKLTLYGIDALMQLLR